MALSYSILEAGRQWSEGGCIASAGEHRSINVPATSTSALAAAAAFIIRYDRASLIGPSLLAALSWQSKREMMRAVNRTAAAKPRFAIFSSSLGRKWKLRDLHASGGEQP